MKTNYSEEILKVNNTFIDKDVWFLKKGKKRVHMLSRGNKHSKVLIPFANGYISKKGFRAELADVRNENLGKGKDI